LIPIIDALGGTDTSIYALDAKQRRRMGTLGLAVIGGLAVVFGVPLFVRYVRERNRPNDDPKPDR
jgi:hypothetical protein